MYISLIFKLSRFDTYHEKQQIFICLYRAPSFDKECCRFFLFLLIFLAEPGSLLSVARKLYFGMLPTYSFISFLCIFRFRSFRYCAACQACLHDSFACLAICIDYILYMLHSIAFDNRPLLKRCIFGD